MDSTDFESLRLNGYSLTPRLIRRGETLELRGRYVSNAWPLTMAAGSSFAPLLDLAFGGSIAGKHPLPATWHMAVIAFCALLPAAFLAMSAATLFCRIRIEFDVQKQRVNVERRFWFWRRTYLFSFSALSAIDASANDGRMAFRCLAVSWRDGTRALLGRFRPSGNIATVLRDLRAQVFGEDEVVTTLRSAS